MKHLLCYSKNWTRKYSYLRLLKSQMCVTNKYSELRYAIRSRRKWILKGVNGTINYFPNIVSKEIKLPHRQYLYRRRNPTQTPDSTLQTNFYTLHPLNRTSRVIQHSCVNSTLESAKRTIPRTKTRENLSKRYSDVRCWTQCGISV